MIPKTVLILDTTMPTVRFAKENREIEVPSGENLRQAAINAGVNLYSGGDGVVAGLQKNVLNCHGFGQCGLCRVLITKGMENTSRMGIIERARFRSPLPTPVTPLGIDPLPCMAYIGQEDEMRLACQTKVEGDIEVETHPALNLFGENFFS